MPKHNTPQPAERTFRHKAYVLVALALLVPIVPFVIAGQWLEPRAEQWVAGDYPQPTIAALVVILLGSDILLPIPSSVVSTLAGQQLGALTGTVCSWLGMSLAAIVGFALARYCGTRWVRGSDDELTEAGEIREQMGVWSLVLSRGLPVLAEATVLHAGLTSISWRGFLLPVLLSNLGISATYAWLGDRAQSPELLAITLGCAAAAPVLLVAFLRHKRRPSGGSTKEPPA